MIILSLFFLPTKILIGKDALKTILDGHKRVFIVTDQFMHESGRVSYITNELDEIGGEFEIYSDVTPDPDISIVSAGVEKILMFKPDMIIALGGGSPIDAAKSIMYFATRQADLKDCPFVAIPTTSGTGSEVSRFAVITDSEKGVKYPLIDDKLLPDATVLDASLVASLPPKITADTGIDVFTHAIEAFISTERTDFSDAMAEKAIKIVYNYLLKTYKEPQNLEYRQRMHNASCLAGAAFSNAGLGINHSMAHALGGKFHVPHGRANGILLPYVMSYNAGCSNKLTPTANRYAKVSRMLNIGTSSTRQSALNLIRTARRLIQELNMPPDLKSIGISREDFERVLPELTETALADRCTSTNPESVDAKAIREIYLNAWAGKGY